MLIMFAQYKIYIYLIASIGLVGIGFTYAWKWQEVRYIQLENQQYADNQRDMKVQAILFNKRLKDTEKNRAEYLESMEKPIDENNALAADLDHARKWMRVLVLRQKSCQAGNAANTIGAESEYAELDPNVRRNILNFRQALIEREALFNFCKAELISRTTL